MSDNISLSKSGSKYLTQHGINAIKDGVKNKNNSISVNKPKWLKMSKSKTSNAYLKTKSLVNKYNLCTVCEEAKCPNIDECWSHGVATIMLMGSVCTRACNFCSVDTGNPLGKLDLFEPIKVANTVKLMNLDYIVLTSVARDDLKDGGSLHYLNTVKEIKKVAPSIKIELLVPDFKYEYHNIDNLVFSDIDVIAQNLETVKRLTKYVRDNRSSYFGTINILKYIKKKNPNILTKTSLMLGVGETRQEIINAMNDLRDANVDILTLGQYMQPTKNHISIDRFVCPEEFEELKEIALSKNFVSVASGPMVRSSYRADLLFLKK